MLHGMFRMYSVHNTNTRHQTAYAGQTDDWRDYSFGLRTRQTYWANTSPIDKIAIIRRPRNFESPEIETPYGPITWFASFWFWTGYSAKNMIGITRVWGFIHIPKKISLYKSIHIHTNAYTWLHYIKSFLGVSQNSRYPDPGLCCAVSWRAVSCRAVRCRAVPCRVVL